MANGSSGSFPKATADEQNDPFSPENQAKVLLEQKAKELHERLTNCKRGNSEWSKYEAICGEILEFSLADCLSNYYIDRQVATLDDTQRMDIFIDNNPARDRGFFRDIRTGLESPTEILIFECKNYVDGIGPKEVLQVRGYEIQGGRHFRAILTREEPKNTAIRAIRHWWTYYGIRIIVLTDKEMHELIDARLIGPDNVDGIFWSTYQSKQRRKWYV